jgi:hypothetical protein
MKNNSNFKHSLHTHASIVSWHRRILTGLILTALLLGATQSQFVPAGASLAPPQAMDPAKVAAAIKGNAQALKAFIWQQRLQLQVKGETKKVTLNQMNYDMYGNLQKTLLSEQPAAEQSSGGGRGGRLKQRIIKKKTGEFKEMMEGIASLVKSYTELPPEQLQAALKQAAFSQGEGDMQGAIKIQMHNVNQQGDSLTLWIDQAAMLFRKIAITTKYEGNPVTATANYDMLQSGQVFMAKAVLNYPKKEVVVEIDNLNYQQSR